ncbi:hypothetical protein GCM10027592_60000 [Spirosoma flavus]
MKHILFIISLMTLLSVRSTAQFVNQGTLFVGAGTTVSTVDSFTNSGASMINNGILSFSANVTNNGGFNGASGEIQLKGSTVQTVGGTSALDAKTLTLQNTAAGQAVLLGIQLSVHETANFNDGILATTTTTSSSLILDDNAQVVGAGDGSHVVGPVLKFGDDIFTFPIGNGTTYRPAVIRPSGNGAYRAQYVESAPTNSGNLAACLSAISANEYWRIDYVLGGGNSAVGLAYQNVATSPTITSSLPNLRVVRYTGSSWGPLSCSANGGTTGGIVLTDGITGNSTNFGLFTLGRVTSAVVKATKVVSGSFTPGSTVTYTISLTNTGTTTQGDNPGNEFTDILPAGLTLLTALSSSGTSIANIGTNTVNWNGDIPASGSVTITILATVNLGTNGQTISNQGSVSYDSDGNGTNEASGLTDDPSVGGASDPTTFVVSCPTLTVTNPTIATATSGAPFSQTFTASGGSSPYSFSTISTLPTGLSLSTTGVLSGTPTQAGTFNLTVQATDAGGCGGTGATYSLTVGAASSITGFAATPAAACIGSPVTYTATIGNVTGAYNFTLTNGSSTTTGNTSNTSFSQNLTAAGSGPQTFTLTISVGAQTTSATTSLTVNAPPVATLSANFGGTLTCAQTSLTLTAGGGTSYAFSGTGIVSQNASAGTAVVNASGVYSVTVTSSGCSSTTSINISQNNTAPTVSITPSSATLTCATPTVSLSAVGSGSGTYRWTTGETTQTISVSTANTYSVTFTGTNGCTTSASATLTQDNTLLTVSITPSSATLICATPTVSLSASGSGTYRWSNGATSQVISVTAANTYSVTLTGTNGCTATAGATVTQDSNLPTVNITPSSATLTCATPTVSLSAVGSAGTYRWSTGETTQAISVSLANTYSVTLTGANGCTTNASATVTQDNTLPTVNITPSSATLTCAAPTVSLSAVGSGTYRWTTGETTQTISVSTANTYSVTFTGTNGCTATAIATVSQDNTLPAVTITATPSLTIGTGQSATLTASGATSYVWSTGTNTASIVVNAGGPYSVTGSAGNGCSVTTSVTVVSQPTGPFAFSSVIANTCQQISANRYVISFTPVYTGTNGQPISFSVVNELFPTTAPGPYTLQLYTDNPVITLKAQQGGTPGEVTYAYNWLAACTSTQPNTPPRVNQPLIDQIAKVGEGFGYTIPQLTFTDNETPQSLVLSVSGLPAGLSFSPPTQIGGVPSVTGVSTVTVTATDPQGLSVSTSFRLTVVEPTATNTPPTLANPIPAQVGIQGQPFTLNVGNTFTDAQTPNALVLTASGLPTGLNLVGTIISGTPSVTGTSMVSLTAVDPGGLSATTSFMLTIQPASVTASAPFAITGVNPITCTQVANNRYEISFTPRYSGLNGQTVTFWVVNELVPTTAPGPYSLQLYNDNPTIVLKARQDGTAGEVSFTYNWLANCGAPPQPNTPPRVNIPLSNQTARVGQEFGYTIPQLTFTDNETPQSLVLSVSGLPAGMNFSPPTQIGGVPSVSGVSSVTVTATDPSGLSVSTTFSLTVLPANAPVGFAITGVQTLSCVSLDVNRRSITFTPQYSGLDGSPVSFSVVNEMLPTIAPAPYTLTLYTDNVTLRLRAQQGGASASYDYNWLAACNAPTRQGVAEQTIPLRVTVLGNPIEGNLVKLNVTGAEGHRLKVALVNGQGAVVGNQVVEGASAEQSVELSFKGGAGLYLLRVHTPDQQQTLKLIKQ